MHAHASEMSGGRWRGASAGVDRRAQLDQFDHIGDRHGLVLLARWSMEPVRRQRRCRVTRWVSPRPAAGP